MTQNRLDLKFPRNKFPAEAQLSCRTKPFSKIGYCVVTSHSPKAMQKSVLCMATYFRREFNYDFVQYNLLDRTAHATVLILSDYYSYEPCYKTIQDNNANRMRLRPHDESNQSNLDGSPIGAVNFRLVNDSPLSWQFHDYQRDKPAIWGMHWAWLHPYYRGKGIMQALWPLLKYKFGIFFTVEPLSASMHHLIGKLHMTNRDIIEKYSLQR